MLAGGSDKCGGIPILVQLARGSATHTVPIGVIEMLFDRSNIRPRDEARWESVASADYNLGGCLQGLQPSLILSR